jgi:hypothetical protein
MGLSIFDINMFGSSRFWIRIRVDIRYRKFMNVCEKKKNSLGMILKQAVFSQREKITYIKTECLLIIVNKKIGICTSTCFRTNTALLWLVKI